MLLISLPVKLLEELTHHSLGIMERACVAQDEFESLARGFEEVEEARPKVHVHLKSES
jgi:hypothetical protein